MSQKILAEMALSLVPGIGIQTIRTLTATFGSAEDVFSQPLHRLLRLPGVGPITAKSIRNPTTLETAERELYFTERNQIRPLFYSNSDYPSRLRQCPDPPPLLFYKGNANLNATKMLAVVGTRKATQYGKAFCDKLIRDLKDDNVVVVSGMALGIDIAAHKAAINSNVTNIAVFAHSLDRIYPYEHKPFARQVLSNGAWLSEYFSNTPPNRENFPRRNRIIAGMVDAVLVVQAAENGGALITADLAIDYNRDVFALPGRYFDENSAGCNKLIKENKASLIQSSQDLLLAMNWSELRPNTSQQTTLCLRTPEEYRILDALADDVLHLESLVLKSGIPLHQISSVILNLELDNAIKSLPGKRYKRA